MSRGHCGYSRPRSAPVWYFLIILTVGDYTTSLAVTWLQCTVLELTYSDFCMCSTAVHSESLPCVCMWIHSLSLSSNHRHNVLCVWLASVSVDMWGFVMNAPVVMQLALCVCAWWGLPGCFRHSNTQSMWVLQCLSASRNRGIIAQFVYQTVSWMNYVIWVTFSCLWKPHIHNLQVYVVTFVCLC